MGNDFFVYLQRLELLAFFSGYPLVYAIVYFIAGNKKTKFTGRLMRALPKAYATLGVLFIMFQVKKLYPDYSFQHISSEFQLPYLFIWGFISILFFIPAFGKKTFFSLLHSLVFFFFLIKDLVLQLMSVSADSDVVSNDMKMYTMSLFLHLGAIILVILLSYLFAGNKKRREP